MRQASDTDVPDTTSGFRAYNREAAMQMAVVSKFTYTLETIIQAGKLLVATDHVPIAHEPEDARVAAVPVDVLLRAPQRGRRSSASTRSTSRCGSSGARGGHRLARARRLGPLPRTPTSSGDGAGHVQSLILGAVLFNAAMLLGALGVHRRPALRPADHAQRIFERVRRIELQLGVAAVALRARRRADRPGRHHRRRRRRPGRPRSARR